MKPSDAEGGNRSDLEASHPWSDSGSDTAVLSDASIRLEEQPTQGRHSFELRSRHSLAESMGSKRLTKTFSLSVKLAKPS